ncbi:hypothetical protein [Limosilactobacillus fermentum]|uniref:hypothetical protein n=1 Tax=Limosilactobacillus fermentum TaxID=1613 RepID=UPI0021CB14E6|nr:hypothetical protein [Limosilactobacillus fermentum]
MSNTSDQTTQPSKKTRLIIDEIGVDTETGIIGRGHSYDNGKTFTVDKTIYGRIFHKSDHDQIWKGIQDKVKTVVEPAKSAADSAVAYANDAIKKSRVNSQAIDDINSAVSDATSDAAVARSDGLRAWNAAQSNVNLIDLNYASASASISSARIEALAAADEAKSSASAAQAGVVAARSDVAAVQADVTATRSDVAVAKSDIADTNSSLTNQAKSLSSYAEQASANGADIVTLKSQAGQLEQDMADTKGDVSQLKVSASSASVALSDAAGNISTLQATAKSFSAALSDTNSNVASVTATASELETKYADAAGDISQIKTDAKGMTQTISDAQGDIAKLKTRADGFDTQFANINGDINKIQTNATGITQTLTNAKSDIAVLQSRADGFDAKYATAAGDINTLKANASGFSQTLTNAQGDISTLKSTVSGVQTTLTDAQGNISTLQSDVSGLKKTTSDNAGNISTLQATANTLTSQMSGAQGDISTLKQTSLDFSSKVSGMATILADANSKINSITSNGGGTNLLKGTAKFDFSFHDNNGTSTIQKYDDETNYVQYTNNTPTVGLGPYWGAWGSTFIPEVGQVYTLSADVCGNGFINGGSAFHYEGSDNGNLGQVNLTNDWQRISNTFHISRNSGWVNWVIYASQSTLLKIKRIKVEKGTVAHDWSPAPEDTDAKITANTTAINQNKTAIALKADQTTVDKTNGTVQQLQSQLKVQADQINAKVSSSDLDAKGYATQTYTQTQIKQTADQWNANLASVKDGLTQSYTNLHATVDGIQAQVYNSDGSSKITQLSNLIATKVSSDDFNNLSKSVNLQTLDSADINNMKTNGHYFVHNLANTPIQGWVYVDVVGNGNDRIRQDVYQDIDNQHCYRRWNGSGWTSWSKGATESEITQLSDDINLRVKSADLISQINLQAGTALIQSNKLVLDAGTTVFTGEAFIPSAAISSISADKIMLGSTSLYNSDGTLNLVNKNDGTTSKITVSQGNVNFDGVNKNASIIKFASDNNTNAFTVNPTGATVTPTLFFERFDQTVGHWLGFTRNEVEHEGVTFHTWDDEAERFFISCHARFDKNLRTLGTFSQGSWDGTTAKPEAGVLTIKGGNTIWSGSNFLAIGDNLSNSYTNVMAKSFSQQSTLSSKTNIEEVDPKDALDLVNRTDIRSYQYTSDVEQGKTKRYTSLILDDVHDVSQYYAPDEFANEERTGRDDGSAVGYLFLAVKELTRRIKTLEEKLNG